MPRTQSFDDLNLDFFIQQTIFLNFFYHFFKVYNLPGSLINVELIERFKVTADIISIQIHNYTLQSFVWSSIAYPCFPFWKLIIFICGFLLQKRWRNEVFEGFKGTLDIPLYKWRVELEMYTHVFHLSNNYII